QLERMHREVIVLVGPGLDRPPARVAGERAERVYRVLVRVLGVDRLTGAERESVPRDAHGLVPQALEMHLDTMLRGVVEGAMAEGRQIEIAAELAVHA